MTMHPKTIEIFLPTGDPQGIRVAAITTRTVCVYEVPRRLIDDFFKTTEAGQVGVYFLFGENEADGAPKVYIGQTGTLRTRLAQHNSGKEFWTRALVAVSRTNTLTSTHAGYLEWFSIQQARDAARYLLDNATSGGRPHTPDPLLADCVELHETIRVLLATLGYPVFEPIARPAIAEASPTATQADGAELYFAKGSGADARGLYTSEGFVVLAGSTGRREIVPSFELHGYNRLREQIIQQGVVRVDADRIRFIRDYLFKSPSAAAACLMGRTANGPVEWKDRAGRTLWEREMQPVATADRADESFA